MHGVDISETAIDWAREKAREKSLDINFHAMDITRDICLLDARFDFIVDSHCLHCIIGEDRKVLIENLRNLLAKDGYIVISTMCQPKEGDESEKYIVHSGVCTRYVGNSSDILDEFTSCGFEVVKHYVDESHDGARRRSPD